jgi:hypothetical protein
VPLLVSLILLLLVVVVVVVMAAAAAVVVVVEVVVVLLLLLDSFLCERGTYIHLRQLTYSGGFKRFLQTLLTH